MSKIYVTLSTFAEYGREPLKLLEESGMAFDINSTGRRMTPVEVGEKAADATAIIAGVELYDADTMDDFKALRCICRCGAGVDNIDLAQAKARGIAVFNTPMPPVDAVAELTLAMVLSLLRRLPEYSVLMKAGKWKRLKTHLLSQRKVGIIGLGKIGRRVAALLKAFDARVSAYDPYADVKWAKANGVNLVSLEELLTLSDIVSIHASQFQEAPFRLTPAQIGAMKNGAILINTARGDMLEEKALIEALQSRKLAGLGLDVFGEEPYAGELTQFNNVVLTPHCATLTVETRVAMEVEAVATAIRFLRGDTDFINRVV